MSTSGFSVLLPAWKPSGSEVTLTPKRSFISWTFGRGCVIYRIWLAVLSYTLFATVIVATSINQVVYLGIPTVMMTVLGVVIGFVISYRASSGYDRYWMGRTGWSEVIKNSRTLARLIWFHVPLRLSPITSKEAESGTKRSTHEMKTVMAEKYMSLDLIKGFAVALKHHLRGEQGIYYVDLYHLIKPLHDHPHLASDRRTQRDLSSATHPHRISAELTASQLLFYVPTPSPTQTKHVDQDLIIPPINAYGTFDLQRTQRACSSSPARSSSRESILPSSSSGTSEHLPLLPANPQSSSSLWAQATGDLVPFAGLFDLVRLKLGIKKLPSPPPIIPTTREGTEGTRRTWDGPVHEGVSYKHRPRVAGGGENVPLDILRCLSQWISVLEDRGTVPGTSLGPMVNTIAAFEDNLTALERILTTPLPFVYSVHIKHTVWIYLFFLPFQLVHDFGYYTILGVAIASFIYLGFLAAGEEIEQPFGYDDNDLDLDLFYQDIIRVDVERLKMSPCLNVFFDPALGANHARIAHGEAEAVAAAGLSNGDAQREG